MKENNVSILTATITEKGHCGFANGFIGTIDGTKAKEEVFLAFKHSRGAILNEDEPTFTPNHVKTLVKVGDQVVFTPNTNPNAVGLALRWTSKRDWDIVANGGKKPNTEQLAAALKGSEWDSPAGKIRMALGDGHQAIQDTAIGKTRYDAAKKMVVIDDIQRFPAECVNPPANMKSEDWIKAGFPGAKGCP